MEVKHSPGPWAKEPEVGRGAWIAAANGHGWAALSCGNDDDEARANAALIAAAPELLGHLRFAVKLLSALPGFSGMAQIEAMQAAIAKAEGAEISAAFAHRKREG